MPSISPDRHDSADRPGFSRPVERIVLTGFMGSGKSTLGRALADRLNWRFLDLDSVIEQRDGRTVARIFAESGEAAFRAMETDALLYALHESRVVVALGGGALDTPANRAALSGARGACVVLLTAGFDILYERCHAQIAANGDSSIAVRPLLGDREAAAARLARRDPVYREMANVVLDTTGQQPDESMTALIAALGTIF